MTTTDVVPYEEKIGALSIGDVRSQVNLIQHVMREVMKKDEHYGVIPGTGSKPSLLKAGAEKLCLTFRLDPQYDITSEKEGAHLTITSKCTLFHIPSGQRFGSGMGSCSTKESKYAYRQAKRKCPKCSAEAIQRSKYPPKDKPKDEPGWYCYAKQGGCGRTFPADDAAITEQKIGRIPNEDIADQYNTVLKMANKRSLVAAVLNTTAASDIFTQDIEDMPQFSGKREPATLDQDEQDFHDLDPTSSAAQSPASSLSSSLGEPGASAVAGSISADQAIELADLCAEARWNKAKVLEKFNAKSFEQLTPAQYQQFKTAALEKIADKVIP